MPREETFEVAAILFSTLQLTTPVIAEFVSGGLLHRLMRVETQKESYALKWLSPRSTQSATARLQLERAESVALMAAEAGIPAAVGLQGTQGNFLHQIGEQWFVLYPWQQGKTLPPTAASPDHCRTMGRLLGRLHRLAIRFPDQEKPVPEAFESGHFERILERAEEQNARWATRLKDAIDQLEDINQRAMMSQSQLQEGWVTGHLDCDQKNVLWQGDAPTILDWESAKSVHPALEAMGAGLSWAGQSAEDTSFESFAAFFRGYLATNELMADELNLAVEAVLGKWVIWLEFNLQRLLDPSVCNTAEYQIAFDAGMHALGATLKLSRDSTIYRNWLQQM